MISDKERLRQQIISNSVNRVGDKMNAENQVENVEDMEMAAYADEEDVVLAEEPAKPVREKLPNILDLVTTDTVTVQVVPKVLFTISYIPGNEISLISSRIKTIEVDGAFYSGFSPMRKGLGTKDNPYGALREPLENFVKFVSDVSDRTTVILGNTAEVAEMLDNVLESVRKTGSEVLFTKYLNNLGMPILNVSRTNSDGSVTDQPVDMRNLFDLSTWSNYDMDESGLVTVNMVFHVNMQFPILYSTKNVEKRKKAFEAMYNTFKLLSTTYSKDVEFYFGFAMDGGTLVHGDARETFNIVLDLAGEELPENVYMIITDDYLENAIENEDDLGILPHSLTRKEIKEKIFNHGGSMLVLRALD